MDQEAIAEHRFWLQVLGDHSRFILNALSPSETGDVEQARRFIQLFDRLLAQSRAPLSPEQLTELNRAALQATLALRKFKLELLDRSLTGRVVIGLPPTFINHMVNELEEYVRILNDLVQGRPVPHFPSLHHDLLWLSDAVGHAASLAADLDFTEKRYIELSEKFEKHFQAFYMKAIEFTGYLRTLRMHYPAIGKFHKDVNVEMLVFMNFLEELEEMGLNSELLSRLDPLVPDHMYREECYYLTKLAKCGQVPQPNCDPGKPRVERTAN
ncbi:DUF2935 domain-containing protein [Paenibacillaceae bacterium WGS1546]|uniref:DUF2935 domain-containing protein n=1 Tax=Cohnella sp. WGS1546 TaxID=3366810 RepID=UPI00372D6DEA